MTASQCDGVASIIASTALNPSRTATACIVPSVHISPAEPRNSRDSIGSANALTNEAPRSKLRGITELNSEDFSEGEANPVASYGECQVQDSMEQGVGLSCIDVYTGDRQLDRNPPRIPHRRVPVR